MGFFERFFNMPRGILKDWKLRCSFSQCVVKASSFCIFSAAFRIENNVVALSFCIFKWLKYFFFKRGNFGMCCYSPIPTILLPNPDEAVEAAPIGELWLEDSVHRPRSIEPPVSDRDFLKRCLLSHRSWLDGLERRISVKCRTRNISSLLKAIP